MKKLMVLMGAALLSASHWAAGVELLLNGNMNDGDTMPAYWNMAKYKEGNPVVSRDTTVFKSAPASVLIAMDGKGMGTVQQRLGGDRGVVMGDLQVSGFIKVEGEISEADIVMQVFDASWKTIAWKIVASFKPGDDWQKIDAKINFPTRTVVMFNVVAKASGAGKVWADDLSVIGADDQNVAATPPPPPPPPPDLSARKTPPYVVVKVDDFRPVNGKVNGMWTKFTTYMESKKLKAGIGCIMIGTDQADPEFFKWVKEKQASGEFEFWLHAWDHGSHKENGVDYNEFNNRSYEEQKKRIDDCQKMAFEKFGFYFTCFGPPGGSPNGSVDENTLKVLNDDAHMQAIMYPQPFDEMGKKLNAQGKVTVLDRVWEVNLESKVGQPDFQKFLEGYAKNPNRSYFILQGHATHWGTPDKYANFTKIIEFLIEQKAIFITPSELAAKIKSGEVSNP